MYSRNGQLGAAFLMSKGQGDRTGLPSMRSVGRSGTGQDQKYTYPNNQCPPGYRQTGTGRDKPPSGYSPPWGEYVLCRPPTPTAAPAPQQAPAPTTNINVSPAIQTQVSPQISPVFQQVQDSPGSTQAATTAQLQPGGQSADTGSAGDGNGTSAAMMEFLRQQTEREEQRRAEEAERRRQLEARQQAAIDKQNADIAQRNADMQAQYEAQLKTSQDQSPDTFQTEVMPGQTFLPAGESAPETVPAQAQAKTLNWPLIIGSVVVVGGLVYFVAYRK